MTLGDAVERAAEMWPEGDVEVIEQRHVVLVGDQDGITWTMRCRCVVARRAADGQLVQLAEAPTWGALDWREARRATKGQRR